MKNPTLTLSTLAIVIIAFISCGKLFYSGCDCYYENTGKWYKSGVSGGSQRQMATRCKNLDIDSLSGPHHCHLTTGK